MWWHRTRVGGVKRKWKKSLDIRVRTWNGRRERKTGFVFRWSRLRHLGTFLFLFSFAWGENSITFKCAEVDLSFSSLLVGFSQVYLTSNQRIIGKRWTKSCNCFCQQKNVQKSPTRSNTDEAKSSCQQCRSMQCEKFHLAFDTTTQYDRRQCWKALGSKCLARILKREESFSWFSFRTRARADRSSLECRSLVDIAYNLIGRINLLRLLNC